MIFESSWGICTHTDPGVFESIWGSDPFCWVDRQHAVDQVLCFWGHSVPLGRWILNKANVLELEQVDVQLHHQTCISVPFIFVFPTLYAQHTDSALFALWSPETWHSIYGSASFLTSRSCTMRQSSYSHSQTSGTVTVPSLHNLFNKPQRAHKTHIICSSLDLCIQPVLVLIPERWVANQ